MLFLRGGDEDSRSYTLKELVKEMVKSKSKTVVVTGGVLLGIGRRSLSLLCRRTTPCHRIACHCPEIDLYSNVDAGTICPIVQGDVFVLDDGGEMDLDLGNYEHFLSVSLTRQSNPNTRQGSNVLQESWNMLPRVTRHASVSPNVVVIMDLLNVFK